LNGTVQPVDSSGSVNAAAAAATILEKESGRSTGWNNLALLIPIRNISLFRGTVAEDAGARAVSNTACAGLEARVADRTRFGTTSLAEVQLQANRVIATKACLRGVILRDRKINTFQLLGAGINARITMMDKGEDGEDSNSKLHDDLLLGVLSFSLVMRL